MTSSYHSRARQPTLQDVADSAQVHRATASRALNPATRHLVNAETADRVERVARSPSRLSSGGPPRPHDRDSGTAPS